MKIISLRYRSGMRCLTGANIILTVSGDENKNNCDGPATNTSGLRKSASKNRCSANENNDISEIS